MAEYLFELSVLDALLICGMAKIIKQRLNTLVDFTEANKIHIPTAEGLSYTLKSRTTYSAKLGLIAKFKTKDKGHLQGTWVITARGWAALRGEPVPKSVRVFRGQILERTTETITLPETFRGYLDRGKKAKEHHKHEIENYDPNEWVQIAGMHQGELI